MLISKSLGKSRTFPQGHVLQGGEIKGLISPESNMLPGLFCMRIAQPHSATADFGYANALMRIDCRRGGCRGAKILRISLTANYKIARICSQSINFG